MPIYSPGADVRHMFDKYDKNGDGHLDKEELKQVFKDLGALIPRWRASAGLKYADANGDGFISLEEMDALIGYAQKFGYKIK